MGAGDFSCAFVFFARVFYIFLAFSVTINAKVFDRCELAQVLHNQHHLDLHEVATWTCIAQHSSDFNTEAYAGGLDGGSHGLFQISDVYWCSPPGKGLACNLPCDRLYDADLTDDLSCLRIIYDEHQRLSGDGYNAWNAYQQFCRHGVENYVQDCFSNERILPGARQPAAHSPFASAPAPFYTPTALSIQSNSISSSYSTHKRGKVYERCELAQELYYKHKMPMEQIPTWVCIAQHESNFDTSAVGHLNTDGSADHGLFQISDLYWCSHDRYSGGKACGLQCTKLLDNDITDDVRCIKRIHSEHTHIAGDGFSAWSVYNRNCRNQQYDLIASCFKDQTFQHAAKTHANASPVSFHSHTPQASVHQPYHANPFLKHIGNPPKSTPTLQYQPTSINTYTQTHNTKPHKGKVYKRCELAQELYFKHKFPMQDIATWVCIAQHESNYDTSAVGRLNGDGSADHGLFQISDLYWCSHDNFGGKACNIPCAKLLDADIADDVKCIRTIHEEHTRISGDGFTAWTVYNGNCRNQQIEQVSACFDNNKISKTEQFLTTTQVGGSKNNSKQSTTTGLAVAKGKIYKECELAQELYYKHGMPLKDIPTWVCIAKHESSFNTAAVGRLNADGSADHGLFQISDLYWCAHEEYGGKACNIPCGKLLDSDISDDIECIKTIHAEHTRISGDGFTAWVVYNGHCRNQQVERVASCFPPEEIAKAQHAQPVKETHAVGFEKQSNSAVGKGKIYSKCELAQELYFKHKMPMKEVPTWVCIAQYESSFNTAAVGRLNADGSADHGLFQISDLYWCSHDSVGGKACLISCNKLLDNDITDDVRCVKTIYEEHTRLSGDGFTAWTVYNRNCRNQKLDRISSCFDSNELQKAHQASQSEPSEKPSYMTDAYNINQITYLSKKIEAKDELHHPFVNNPFLNQYSAVKFVPATATPKKTTAKLATHAVTNEVVPSKMVYINNPFLNQFIQSSQFSSATTSKPKIHTNVDPTNSISLPYASNPFFSNHQQTGTKVQMSSPSPQSLQKFNLHSNPFLTKYISPTPNSALIEATHKQTFTAVPPEKQLATQYQNNPFLQKFTAATHSLKLQQQTHTTPSGTEKTKLHVFPTRPYVNSDLFRTTPVRTQATSTQHKLGLEMQKPSETTKGKYVITTTPPVTRKTQTQYYANLLTTTTRKPTTQTTAIRKPIVEAEHKNKQTTHAGISPTKRPSTTTTWNWRNQSLVKPTKAPSTQKTTSTTKPHTTIQPKTSVSATRAPHTTARTTKLQNTQKSVTAISSTRKTAPVTTTQKPATTKMSWDYQWQKPNRGTTSKPRTTQKKLTTGTRTTQIPQTKKSISTTTTTKPTTEKISTRTTSSKAAYTTKTATIGTERPSTAATRRPTTTVRSPLTQKTSVAIKTTTRPTTTTQKTTKRTTTSRKSSTTRNNQLQYYLTTTTRKPTTTIRTTITQKPFASFATTKTKTITNIKNFTTTKVPYTTKKVSTISPITQFKTKSQNFSITTRATAKTTAATATKRITTTRTTARKPALYATSAASATNRKPNAPTTKVSTTTLKPKITVSSTVTTTNPYHDDPFSHPFFAKYKEKFEVFALTTTRKPASTVKYQAQTRFGEESEYLQQFRNHTAGNVKTVYAYAFGQNGTLTGHYGR
ncbi:uncharacterized protein LOC128860282 isoform X1 [Anastrepha ludens]|uniref:uncharacterized protein LOC128860282 isoform X1 n=1 Tax=Anastrepha ludens TaxID=28586 RepID=UPI0023B18BC6|nr:uncharacterized protein LOC128860282 isoform X1 [Anastrepha ludens]